MKRALTFGIVMCVGLFANLPQAHADSYYRINLRAYRRMMHSQGPHPLADRFWGFVDNNLLQTNGPADQFFKEFAKKLIEEINKSGSGQKNADNDGMIAQRTAEPDKYLTDADAKVRAMCNKLNIKFIEIPKIPPAVPPQNTDPNQTPSNLDQNFFSPAPVPAGFTGPTNPPPRI